MLRVNWGVGLMMTARGVVVHDVNLRCRDTAAAGAEFV
jgi:hypothetical protein